MNEAAVVAAFHNKVVWGGFLIALAFGWIAARTNFCTMGALADIVTMQHWGRLRMWLLAVAVAIIGTTALVALGLINTSDAVVMRPGLRWLSLLIGGLLFGVGMSLAGGCANKNLVRLGGGSLRSLVVLVFLGLSADMTLKGVLASGRASLLDPFVIDLGARGWPDQSLGTLLAQLSGLAPRTALILAATALAAALLIVVFKDARFRRQRVQVAGGALLGVLIAAGWWISGHLGHGENPQTLEMVYFATNSRSLESLSFVAPAAFTLEWLMRWSDASLRLSFGVASLLGIVAGSLLDALGRRRFRWEGFGDVRDLSQHLVGALLMGFGGVTALGCTVGQGLSGVSTLAMGSFLALGSIVLGSVVTLRWMAAKAERDA